MNYMWQKWTTAVLGLLVLVVPFMNLSSDTLTRTLVFSGAIIAGLSIWAAMKDVVPSAIEHMGQSSSNVNRMHHNQR